MLKIIMLLLLGGSLALAQEPAKNEVFAKVVNLKEMDYPYKADLAHIRGAVIIRAKLDERGKVVAASVISGHPLWRRKRS